MVYLRFIYKSVMLRMRYVENMLCVRCKCKYKSFHSCLNVCVTADTFYHFIPVERDENGQMCPVGVVYSIHYDILSDRYVCSCLLYIL